jgi:CubicO group peptidase (beta-lactamase class C family)
MKTDVPRWSFPPEPVTAYPDYGATLAGLLAEQVSGIPFLT